MPLFGPPNIDKMVAKRNIDGLIKLLDHQDLDLRVASIKALGDLGDARAVMPLANRIGNIKLCGYDPEKRAILAALYQLKDRRAIPDLIKRYLYEDYLSRDQKMVRQTLDWITLDWGKLPEAHAQIMALFSHRGLWLGNTATMAALLTIAGETSALRAVGAVQDAAAERRERNEGMRRNDD